MYSCGSLLFFKLIRSLKKNFPYIFSIMGIWPLIVMEKRLGGGQSETNFITW